MSEGLSTKSSSFWHLRYSFVMKMTSCNASQCVKLKVLEVSSPHLRIFGLGQKPTPVWPKPAGAEFTTIDVQAINGITRNAIKMILGNPIQRVK